MKMPNITVRKLRLRINIRLVFWVVIPEFVYDLISAVTSI